MVSVLRDSKSDIIPAALPYSALLGSVVLNRRQLPPLFYGSSIVLRSLQWRLPPSLITTESICRWFFPFYPLFLCSSLSVPALSVCCGGFLFSIQHQTTISTGSWAAQWGGSLNMLHWLLSFSEPQINWPRLFFLRIIQTACKKKMISALGPLISTRLASKLFHDCPWTHLFLRCSDWRDLELSLIEATSVRKKKKLLAKFLNDRFWSFKPQGQFWLFSPDQFPAIPSYIT